MNGSKLNRRDFGKLTLAAFGGVMAGSLAARSAFAGEEAEFKLGDPHICCGLNTCKGKGADGKNECAGMGSCATAEAHGCHGANNCAGQGQEGTNSCKGKGTCGVPVSGDTWKKARTRFEAAMKKADKAFGDAPASCGKG